MAAHAHMLAGMAHAARLAADPFNAAPEGSPARHGPAGAGLVISCEHGGNRIPPPYEPLFSGDALLLESHRGHDPGALTLAEDLAVAFGAPCVASTVSRLLVDLNRSIGHPPLHAAAVARLPVAVREQLLAEHYRPYRSRAESLVRQAIADHGRVIHLSSHSFTPELDGKRRRADIGLLYDPARPGEVDLCRRWKASLAAAAPQLVVRRNYPYAGKNDGLTRWFRRCLPADRYVGIELEVNQKHVLGAGLDWAALRALIVDSLEQALACRSATPA